MRTFMALRTSSEVSAVVSNVQDELKESEFYGSWPVQDNVHLTLFFFGEIDVKKSKGIMKIMDEVAPKIDKFFLTLNTVGFFPPKGLPRVIWLGCEDDKDVQSLYMEINGLLKKHGFEFRERFIPHITVGRIKGVPKGWRGILSEMKYKPVKFKCGDVELFSSRLTPHGSVYTLIHRSELGGLHDER